MKEITKEQFAKVLFAKDCEALEHVGEDDTWETTDQAERNSYLGEAEFFMALPRDEWPSEMIAFSEKEEKAN
jgi:hypothetical protein